MTDKKKPPKKRVDNPSSVQAAMIAGGRKIVVPKSITFTPKQRLIFTEICSEFSKSELTAHKIRLAAILARDVASLDDQQKLLQTEGEVFVNSHGNPTCNPRVRVVQTLSSTVLSLRRSLGVHARDLAGGDSRRVGMRRAHDKANEGLRENYEDNLIAFPQPISTENDDDRE